MPPVLSVPVFTGVVLTASPDARSTDEISACDSYDVGPRGQLVVASDISQFAKTTGGLGGTGMSPIYGILASASPQQPILLYVGKSNTNQLFYATMMPDGSADAGGAIGAVPENPLAGIIATFAEFPYVDPNSGKQLRVVLVCAGSRSFQNPDDNPGLFAFAYDSSGPSYTFRPISDYDALGTGPNGEFPTGTHGLQLAPRGVVAYNGHAFLWGLDYHASGGGGDGPNRLMFSNIGNPLKYGNDADAQGIADGVTAESDRAFEDSDAIIVGGAGEAIRNCYVWNGKLWIGTNKELHYLEGFGRESFQTNGAIPVVRSRNVIGPHAMVEGPDTLLYGVSDEGLWRCNGTSVDAIGDVLRDYATHSEGWWDLIWSNPAATELTFPGFTNQDLVWMFSDRVANQVVVVIPYCNAEAGAGAGSDTVMIKFNVITQGFTRQVFTSIALTAGNYIPREPLVVQQQYIANSSDPAHNIQRYRYKALPTDSPVLPTALPDVSFGEKAPFGPVGVGVMSEKYFTVSWDGAALPLAWDFTITIDGQPKDTVRLTIGPTTPVSPNNGDTWVDTSGTDTNLGNGTAGTIVPSNPADYIIRRWITTWAKWVQVPGGGQQGSRLSVRLAFQPSRGTRFNVRALAVTVNGRYQIEGFADKPEEVSNAA